jgi:two-component system alkaline phosphatase synthesis response regulator PhoP
MHKIAVVDDDPEWGDFVSCLLKPRSLKTSCFPTSGKFFDSLIKTSYELVVLDMHLPGMHGREVIRVLRANPQTRRMLIVGVSGEEIGSADAVSALDAGADEYLSKPVDAEFLAARITALLRRAGDHGAGGPEPERITLGALSIEPDQQQVRVDGKAVVLTNLEFQLLLYCVRNVNRVLTRPLILEQVWGVKTPMDTRTVDKHVESLRRKLGPFGKKFETVVKVGYCLKA